MKSQRTVAGIDIGGDRKGNHLVVLHGTRIVCNLRKATPEREGIATAALRSIDDIDAALCALAAHYLLENRVELFGDESGGYIVVPASQHLASAKPDCA